MAISISIDIGGSEIRFGLVQDCKVIKFSVKPTPKTREEFEEIMLSKTKEMILYANENFKRHKLSHIGVSCPGPADYKKGIIVNPINLPFLKEYKLKELLKVFKYSVIVENDANCFVLAQAILDKNPSKRILFGITLGTGIGGGLSIDEHLYKGNENACEIGHWLYGNSSFEEEYKRLKDEYKSKLGVEEFQEVGKAALKGNDIAKEAFEKIGRLIGDLSYNVILAYAPDVIIFGGGLSYSWSLLKKHIVKAINRKNKIIINKPTIKRNSIPKANLIGASLLTKY
ncbi:MAG: glucokinase [Candidatus Woesearchaeota archaeon]|nr:glucokinase [Candidatus Woesearchaeota archaeon]MDK2908313.1 glucokinase [Candidatus Woesearchaeota archaeon]